jgi:hypothetical protein
MFLSDFFGVEASPLTLEENAAGDAVPYKGFPIVGGLVKVQRYTWVRPGQDRWGRTERYIIEIAGSRLYGASHIFSLSQEQKALSDWMWGSRFHGEICFAVFAALFAPIFFRARIYSRLFQWRPVALFSTPFAIASLSTVPNWSFISTDSLLVTLEIVIFTLGLCVACGLLLGYYFFTVNYLLARYWSTKWSTFQSLCQRRFQPVSGVPLAIVRGAALASMSLGVCTVLRYGCRPVSLRTLGTSRGFV